MKGGGGRGTGKRAKGLKDKDGERPVMLRQW